LPPRTTRDHAEPLRNAGAGLALVGRRRGRRRLAGGAKRTSGPSWSGHSGPSAPAPWGRWCRHHAHRSL